MSAEAIEAPVAGATGARPRFFRSFKAKLMALVALAVSLPALCTCLILGIQLDRQARTLFANGLQANTKNLFEGLTRVAADNTLQITLDLEMKSQLTNYIEAQRQVLAITFLAVYDKNSRNIALSADNARPQQNDWRFAGPGETAGAACVVAHDAAHQLVSCHDVVYLVSTLPINRVQDASLGDASTRTQGTELLGYILGGVPLSDASLIGSLRTKRIDHPLIGTDTGLIYSNVPTKGLRWPIDTDATVHEYDLGGTRFLSVGKALTIGTRRVLYAVLTPLAPLETALWQSIVTVAVVGLAVVLATLGALSFLVNRLLNPISRLREGAALIGRGDLGHRIAIRTGDELQALADQFNETAGRLQESYADLEKKVEVRTSELSEALEQQTATSEVLRVISSSPGELEPVFEAMLENAARICQANNATLFLRDGDFAVISAQSQPGEGARPMVGLRRPLVRGWVPGRAILDARTIHVPDFSTDNEYTISREESLQYGNRCALNVPLLREGVAIGAMALRRRDPVPFTDKQIELVTNFASQAVIAIENARLLTELRARTDELARSVGELRALGEVSQAVNSTLDAETVLRTIVTKAVELSATDAGAIYVFDDDHQEFRLRATYGMTEAMIAAISSRHIGTGDANIGAAAQRREPIQIADLREAPASPLNDIILGAGYRALLVIPLLSPDRVVGALVVRRKEPGAFPASVVDLLETFADQSVLAIQNARLFREIEEKGRELELASRHKSQFLANMSHELRTPLNAVLGYTELILDNIYGEAPEKMRAVVERIQNNGRHLLGLINDVLDLSKIEAGQLALSLSDYSLEELIHGVYVSVEPLAAEKRLALKTIIAPGLPVGHGDERRLAQVLLNLVGNAIKFTESGEVVIAGEVADGAFRVAVRDTGPGIAAADQVRIFEEFQQVDSSSTRKQGGTGLGLAISKRIVEMHGGRIVVDSERGHGSTFTVVVPIQAGPGARPS
jgi:signal transduction histidine kinase/HAMP domain-containing protein